MYGADYYNNMSHFLQIHSTGNAHIFAVYNTRTAIISFLSVRCSNDNNINLILVMTKVRLLASCRHV